MLRMMQERAAEPSQRGRFASPAALCRRRADSAVAHVVVVGGRVAGGNGAVSSVMSFEPSSGEWGELASMATARMWLGMGVVGGKLYAVGGWDGSTTLSSVECFDPETQQWSAAPSMSTARTWAAAVVLDRKLYVMGGTDGNCLSSVECANSTVTTYMLSYR